MRVKVYLRNRVEPIVFNAEQFTVTHNTASGKVTGISSSDCRPKWLYLNLDDVQVVTSE